MHHEITNLPEPRFVQLGILNLIGTSRVYPFDKAAQIPDQWQAFGSMISQLTADADPVTYGVVFNSGEAGFDYLTAVEANALNPARENVASLQLTPQTYAVFWHSGHVATVRQTCAAIWSEWLPSSGMSVVQAPWFERYGPEFNPLTGAGGLEVWIPVEVDGD